MKPGDTATCTENMTALFTFHDERTDTLGDFINAGEPLVVLEYVRATQHVMALWKVLTRDGRVGYMIASHLKALRP